MSLPFICLQKICLRICFFLYLLLIAVKEAAGIVPMLKTKQIRFVCDWNARILFVFIVTTGLSVQSTVTVFLNYRFD